MTQETVWKSCKKTAIENLGFDVVLSAKDQDYYDCIVICALSRVCYSSYNITYSYNIIYIVKKDFQLLCFTWDDADNPRVISRPLDDTRNL